MGILGSVFVEEKEEKKRKRREEWSVFIGEKESNGLGGGRLIRTKTA